MDRHRAWGSRVLGGSALAVVVGLAGCDRLTRNVGIPLTKPAAAASAPARSLTERLAAGDGQAVEEFHALVRGEPGTALAAIPADKAADVLQGVTASRAGFEKLDPVHRAQSIKAVSAVIERLSVEPAPEGWAEAMTPAAEQFTLGMGDNSPAVRVSAAEAVGRLWAWKPGANLWEDQERAVGAWKERLYTPLAALLDDPEPGVRLTAVAALGRLPLDEKAAPAVARLADPELAVRLQVLNSFAARRDVMTDEDVLPRLFDSQGPIALAAKIVLRARGLEDEQIDLAKAMYDPSTEARLAAIPALLARTDIDPVVWLLQLSHDREEAVRIEAVKALANRTSPEACKRIAEMAIADPSERVRKTVSELPQMAAGLTPKPGANIPSPTAN